MKTNIGTVDKIIRFIFGLTLLAIAFSVDHILAKIGYIGILPILTASIGYCPMYSFWKINTISKKDCEYLTKETEEIKENDALNQKVDKMLNH